jgi:hypothetical protein
MAALGPANGVPSVQDGIQKWEQHNKMCVALKIVTIVLAVAAVALSVILIASTNPILVILGLATIAISVIITHDMLKMANKLQTIFKLTFTGLGNTENEQIASENASMQQIASGNASMRLAEGTIFFGPFIRLLKIPNDNIF